MIRTLFRNELRDTWRWLLALTGGAVLIVGMLTVVAAWLPQPLSSVSAGTAVVGAFAFPYADLAHDRCEACRLLGGGVDKRQAHAADGEAERVRGLQVRRA